MSRNNLVKESMFGYGDEMGLPAYVRCYLDYCAQEYGTYTTEEKIQHMGYLAIRGVDFYREIKEHVEDKVATPGYGNYMDVAKQSLANYIGVLRSGDGHGLFYPVYCEMTLLQLYRILVKELKLRYTEYNDPFEGGLRYDINTDYWDDEAVLKRFEEGEAKELKRYLRQDEESKRVMRA